MKTITRSATLAGLAVVWLSSLGSAALFSQERFRRVAPPPDPLPELRLPNVETVTLTNGLTLSTVYRDGQPFINIQFLVLAGEAASPKGLPGLASFTANMLPRGTLQLSSANIEERVESLGGRFTVSTRLDYTLFSFQFLEEYLDQALDLLGQLILQQSFSERELGLVRYTMYYDLLSQEKDPTFVARRHLLRELFRNHPYGQGFFNKEAVKNIKLADVSDFFQTYYRPDRTHIILTGNVNLREAIRKVSHVFNTWTRGPAARAPLPLPPANKELRVVFIDVPAAPDGIILAGNIVPAMTSPDYFPLTVFHQVLGGSVNSRLILNLRESKGYAYYVFSELDAFPGFGLFFIRARVAPEFVFASVREILKEVRQNMAEKLPPAEVEQAKTFLLGNFPLTIERLEDFSNRITELKALGLGDNYWSRYYENTMLVDAERVFQVAQSLPLLTPIIVIAGDKTVLAGQLKYFDKVDIYNAQGAFQYSLIKETEK